MFKKLLALNGSRMFITVFTKAHNWSLSWSQLNPIRTLTPYLRTT